MSDKIELYHFDRCPYCEKARRGFMVLGVKFESHTIDPDDRDEVIAISGNRSVPMIVHGETVMNESTKIIEYLDNKFQSDINLIPSNRSHRGHAYMLDKYAEKVWGGITSYAMKEKNSNGDPLDNRSKASLQEKIYSEASILNDFFCERKFAAAENLSLADLSISAFLSRIEEFSNFNIDRGLNHLWDWLERVNTSISPTLIREDLKLT